MPTIDLTLGLVNDLGAFALVAMLYRSVLEHFDAGPAKALVIGLLFGLAAAFSIISASWTMPGVVIDPRNVMLVLAAPFGGLVAAIAAAVIAGTARIWVGGAGLPGGLVNIGLVIGVGCFFHYYIFRKNSPISTRNLIVLGVATNVSLLPVAFMPLDLLTRLLSGPLPILAAANLVGVIVLGRFLCRERKAVHMTRTLASEATTDELTQLPNRRMLERRTDRMFEEAGRKNHPVSVLVIDIDRFKQFNDRFGHDVGDAVLKNVANAVQANVRATDALARFGGEEIVVAMPNTSREIAAIVAERIRSVVDTDVFHLDRDSANVTVSIGVATGQEPALTFKALFKHADEALFVAKRLGRNQVQLADLRTPLGLAAA